MDGFAFVLKDIFSQMCFCFRPFNQWFQDRPPPGGNGEFMTIDQNDSSTPSDLMVDENDEEVPLARQSEDR